ncbi:MAG TPA: VOC family protein [Novosphingobium sp.]|nr:VOC family protein [Novosphingobium sp.]
MTKATIQSIRVGTNDLERARAFYDATFAAVGVSACSDLAKWPIAVYALGDGMRYLVGRATNGEPAAHANGGTILLNVSDPATVDAWHATGLANGGTCEGTPGPRDAIGGRYGAYLRDPDGNKLGCFVGSLFGV